MSGTTRWTYLDRFWLSRLSKSLCQELVLSGLLGCLLAKMYLSFSLSRKKKFLELDLAAQVLGTVTVNSDCPGYFCI